MEKDEEMMDYEELIGILIRRPKHPPAKVETVREFLKEFGRIGQVARLEFSLAEFKPFLESMRDTARAAMRTERAPKPKWRLRSRIVRPPGEEEMQARIRLHAANSLDLVTSIRTPSGEPLDEGSPQARLAQVAVEFSTALRACPDLLLKADPSEIHALESAAKQFANID
ncbi:MAG: hypothetical protein WCH98_09430 [Verrucomicrobiota bacterium]